MVRPIIDFSEGPGCAVGQSYGDRGQGVFAIKLFMRGDIVIDYSKTSQNWELRRFRDIPREHQVHNWWVGESMELALLGSPDSLFMRVNHDNNPNTYWNTTERHLAANRMILPGQEITFDYRLQIAPPYFKCRPEWMEKS